MAYNNRSDINHYTGEFNNIPQVPLNTRTRNRNTANLVSDSDLRLNTKGLMINAAKYNIMDLLTSRAQRET